MFLLLFFLLFLQYNNADLPPLKLYSKKSDPTPLAQSHLQYVCILRIFRKYFRKDENIFLNYFSL